jgi:hypothetical protein
VSAPWVRGPPGWRWFGGRRDHRPVPKNRRFCASCDAAHISWKGAEHRDKKPAWCEVRPVRGELSWLYRWRAIGVSADNLGSIPHLRASVKSDGAEVGKTSLVGAMGANPRRCRADSSGSIPKTRLGVKSNQEGFWHSGIVWDLRQL